MYAVMNEDEACLLSAIKAGAPLNSHIDLEDTSVAGKFFLISLASFILKYLSMKYGYNYICGKFMKDIVIFKFYRTIFSC